MKGKKSMLVALIIIVQFQIGITQCGTYNTIAAGDYFSATTWQNGLLPPNPIPLGTTVIINHDLTINGVLENNGTINAVGHTLTCNVGHQYGGSGNLNGDFINSGTLTPGNFPLTQIPPILAGLTTTDVSAIMETTATSGGELCYDGGAMVTTWGVCWSTSMNPTVADYITTDGSGTGSYTSSLTGLTAATLYYLRSYATNSEGTSYGQETNFTTLSSPWSCGNPLLYDGQSYATVLIGGQCWMAENLNVGTMVNGSGNQNNTSTIEKYCYGDNVSNCDTYGGLYQWNEMMQYVNTESTQGICPTGWHLPSDTEWKTLEIQLGMLQSQADATSLWRGTNEGSQLAGNESLWSSGSLGGGTGLPPFGTSGFTALPAGYRNSSGLFNSLTQRAFFWSSSESVGGADALRRALSFGSKQVYRDAIAKSFDFGFSVRCVKN